VKDFSIFEYALKFSDIEQTENLGEISNVSRRDSARRGAPFGTRRDRPLTSAGP